VAKVRRRKNHPGVTLDLDPFKIHLPSGEMPKRTPSVTVRKPRYFAQSGAFRTARKISQQSSAGRTLRLFRVPNHD
jgi:hypothetical protein